MARYDKPAIVRMKAVVKLGEPKTLSCMTRFKREHFMPNRLLMNVIGPGMFVIDRIECRPGENELVEPVDAYNFRPLAMGGLQLALPASQESYMGWSGSYTGAVVGYGLSKGKEFELLTIFAEPGVGLHLGNYEDITLEDN